MNRKPQPGSAVIIRSNEDEPLQYGILLNYDDMGGKARPALAVVLIDNKKYWCASAVIEDNEVNRKMMDGLDPLAQWQLACFIMRSWR